MFPCEIVEIHRKITDLNTRPHNCCCNCKHHLKDFHHCTTVEGRKKGDPCYCNDPKGWICMGEIACDPENGRAHSGWGEHGECELHEYVEVVVGRKTESSGEEAAT
jgi:hypothetical protein